MVARRDGLSPDLLRDLAQSARAAAGLRAVVLGGSPDGEKAALAVSADRDGGRTRAGPGGRRRAGQADRAAGRRRRRGLAGDGLAGGKDPAGIDRALDEARRVPRR